MYTIWTSQYTLYWPRTSNKQMHLLMLLDKPLAGLYGTNCDLDRMRLFWVAPLLSCSSSRLSNGETESVKTMIVHDEGESDAGSTPCKDSTLIVRQVLAGEKKKKKSDETIIRQYLSLFRCVGFSFILHVFVFTLWSCFCVSFGHGEQLSCCKA